VRSLVAPLEDDRVIAPDVEAVHAVITSGEFLNSVRRATGKSRVDVRSDRKGKHG